LTKDTLVQNENKLIKIVKDAYEKGDKELVINRAKISFEAFLSSGLNSGHITRQLIDVGFRLEELGIGLMQAIIRVDDSKLCDTDKTVKKEALRIYGKILLDVVEQVSKESQ